MTKHRKLPPRGGPAVAPERGPDGMRQKHSGRGGFIGHSKGTWGTRGGSALLPDERPRTSPLWLACPHCGNVSKTAAARNPDGTCRATQACLARQRE